MERYFELVNEAWAPVMVTDGSTYKQHCRKLKPWSTVKYVHLQ